MILLPIMKPKYYFQPVVDGFNRKCFCFMDETGRKLALAGKTDFRSRDHFAQCFQIQKDSALDFTGLEAEIPFEWYDIEYKKPQPKVNMPLSKKKKK